MVKLIDKYRLLRTLGEGQWSKVKYAINTETQSAVAVKVVSRKILADARHENYLRREIRIMKHFRSPHFVRLIEVLSTNANVYIVMQLCTGGELFDRIISEDRFDEGTARRFFRQLCEGVAYMHSHGIAHRDLKPENLLLDEDEVLKITDFGFSAVFSNDHDALQHGPGPDTGLGGHKHIGFQTVVGTMQYSAPEVLKATINSKYDGRKSDVWSCGVILFVMLAGYLPFDEASGAGPALIKRICERRFRRFPKWVSPEARDLLERMMTVDTDVRITMREIFHHPWMQKDGIKPPMEVMPMRKRGRTNTLSGMLLDAPLSFDTGLGLDGAKESRKVNTPITAQPQPQSNRIFFPEKSLDEQELAHDDIGDDDEEDILNVRAVSIITDAKGNIVKGGRGRKGGLFGRFVGGKDKNKGDGGGKTEKEEKAEKAEDTSTPTSNSTIPSTTHTNNNDNDSTTAADAAADEGNGSGVGVGMVSRPSEIWSEDSSMADGPTTQVTKLPPMNAFELVNLLTSANLSSMAYRGSDTIKRPSCFLSARPALEILKRLDMTMTELRIPHRLQLHSYKVKVSGWRAVAGDPVVSFSAQLYQIVSGLHMVEFNRRSGDVLFFHKVYRQLRDLLGGDIVGTQQAQTMARSMSRTRSRGSTGRNHSSLSAKGSVTATAGNNNNIEGGMTIQQMAVIEADAEEHAESISISEAQREREREKVGVDADVNNVNMNMNVRESVGSSVSRSSAVIETIVDKSSTPKLRLDSLTATVPPGSRVSQITQSAHVTAAAAGSDFDININTNINIGVRDSSLSLEDGSKGEDDGHGDSDSEAQAQHRYDTLNGKSAVPIVIDIGGIPSDHDHDHVEHQLSYSQDHFF